MMIRRGNVNVTRLKLLAIPGMFAVETAALLQRSHQHVSRRIRGKMLNDKQRYRKIFWQRSD